MKKIKIDFIHIGYHKTASTFLQTHFLNRIDNLKLLNFQKGFDNDNNTHRSWFEKNFIKVDDRNYNKEIVYKYFLNQRIDHNAVNCISDENLSGDIYSDSSSLSLMKRIYQTFEDPKILIVIRAQADWILSAYGNYIVHKGNKSIRDWLKNNIDNKFLKKIKYYDLINNYVELFGKDNVDVICYENLFHSSCGINSYLERYGIITKDNFARLNKMVNHGRSLKINEIIAFLNKFLPSSLYGRIARLNRYKSKLKKNEIDYVKSLIPEHMIEYYEINKKLNQQFELNMPQSYF